MLIEKKEEEIREKYILQAFNAWLQGAGQKKKFDQFIRSLGLQAKKNNKEKQLDKQTSEMIAKRNIENSQRILLLDRKNRNEG